MSKVDHELQALKWADHLRQRLAKVTCSDERQDVLQHAGHHVIRQARYAAFSAEHLLEYTSNGHGDHSFWDKLDEIAKDTSRARIEDAKRHRALLHLTKAWKLGTVERYRWGQMGWPTLFRLCDLAKSVQSGQRQYTGGHTGMWIGDFPSSTALKDPSCPLVKQDIEAALENLKNMRLAHPQLRTGSQLAPDERQQQDCQRWTQMSEETARLEDVQAGAKHAVRAHRWLGLDVLGLIVPREHECSYSKQRRDGTMPPERQKRPARSAPAVANTVQTKKPRLRGYHEVKERAAKRGEEGDAAESTLPDQHGEFSLTRPMEGAQKSAPDAVLSRKKTASAAVLASCTGTAPAESTSRVNNPEAENGRIELIQHSSPSAEQRKFGRQGSVHDQDPRWMIDRLQAGCCTPFLAPRNNSLALQLPRADSSTGPPHSQDQPDLGIDNGDEPIGNAETDRQSNDCPLCHDACTKDTIPPKFTDRPTRGLWFSRPHRLRLVAKTVWTEFTNAGAWNSDGTATMVGLLSPIISMIGFDCVVHMSEEVKDAGSTLPKALLWSVAFNAALEFLMAVTICFCLGDVTSILSTATGYPFIQVFYNVTHSYAGASAMTSLLILTLTSAAIAEVATASRQLWSFARDKGVPGYRWPSKITPGSNIPLNAVLVSLTVTSLLSLINIGSTAALNAILALTNCSLTGESRKMLKAKVPTILPGAL
ncbi:hypothetical protein LTR53_001209 [Teratosphaeriaceae sp. CCFEE 6253]|nr:hypothetical protein LTR53_001209 [Teratosphaeriaceae sp. CCFEE 6253]